MRKEEIFEELSERDLLKEGEQIILIDGLERAFLGVSATKPIVAVYDYWMCIDILVKDEKYFFDDALDFVDEIVDEDMGTYTPEFVKIISPTVKHLSTQ